MANGSRVRSSEELRFMTRLAEQGFSFAGQYIEQQCGCAARIVGSDGRELYRSGMFATSSRPFGGTAAHFDERACELSYPIALDGGSALIALNPIAPENVEHAMGILDDVRAPLTYHLVSHESSRRRIEALEKDMSAELFANGSKALVAYARAQGYQVDEAGSYFVAVTRMVQGGGYDWAATTERVRRYLREQGASDVIDIGIADGFVHVFPSSYVLSERERTLPSQKLYDLALHKRVHDERNGIVTTVGVGRAYAFPDLERSLLEATQALELGWLMGRGGAMMRYDRLGVFALLLDGDRDALEAYCARTLGPLLEAEASSSFSLLGTLRLMLDHSLRWAEVSRLLFVHVNTLRYRMDKIAELLGVDLADPSARADVYVALKLHDLLHIAS